MIFCCEQFKNNHSSGLIDDSGFKKEVYPNIKIVKLSADKYNHGVYLYRYILVCGFLSKSPPFVIMKYCPFCGTHLLDYYQSDEYVNASSFTFFG